MRLLPCTHRPTCPGCGRYGEPGLAERPQAVLSGLASACGARLEDLAEGAPLGFRLRARLAVRGRAASPKVGIFQEGSHSIADIPSCTIHHPAINATAREIRRAIRAAGIPPYADRPHSGLLRYVQIVVERTSQRVQVVLVANDDSEHSLMPLVAELVPRLDSRLQALWWNGNAERTNRIFGSKFRLLAGEEAVRERIGGVDVFFPPGAFGQSNLDLSDRLVADIHERVGEDRVVAELYCGVGSIGLGLVERSREVRFNEVSPQGLVGLDMGLAALPRKVRARAGVEGGDAAEAVGILEGADTVIVDPPRKGLDAPVLAALEKHRPRQLVYVSCDVDSLRRDAGHLTGRAGYRLESLKPYALFPYTDHVETLAEFTAV